MEKKVIQILDLKTVFNKDIKSGKQGLSIEK
jgi:hypothetical protein